MKITLNDLVEVIHETPYQDNKELLMNTIIEVLQKKHKNFTPRQVKNFKKQCNAYIVFPS